MKNNTEVSMVAPLVSEPSRAAILTVLLDGRFHPASELASMAKIKPQTASFHLNKLIQSNIITQEKHGRHRYYGIDNEEVARVLELLLTISKPLEVKSFKQASEDKAIRVARTCYDHLAGNLGVQLTQSLVKSGYLVEEKDNFKLTEHGEKFFTDLEIDLQSVKKKRRAFSPKCLDWSERRHHLAGALGNAILEKLLEKKWIERQPTTRAIKITTKGLIEFKDVFSLVL